MMESTNIDKKQKRCLSLSAKGVLGRWTVYFMGRLEDDLNFSFYDEFDTFTGTSGGALITAGIILQIPFDVLFTSIFNLSKKMFSSNITDYKKVWSIVRNKTVYNHELLKNEVIRIIDDKTLREVAKNKTVLFTTIDVDKEKYQIFSMNLNKNIDTPDTLLCDAVLGSSSIPLLFGEIITKKEKLKIIDAGLICPNPALDSILLQENKEQFNFTLLSIIPPKVKVKYEKLKGLKKLFYIALDLHPTSSSSRTEMLVKSVIDDKNCFFSNPTFPNPIPIDSHSPEKFDVLFNEHYYKQREGITKYLKNIGVIPKDRKFKYEVGEKHKLDELIEKLIKE